MEKITLQVKYKTKKDNNIVTLFVELIFARIEELHDFFMSFETLWKQRKVGKATTNNSQEYTIESLYIAEVIVFASL